MSVPIQLSHLKTAYQYLNDPIALIDLDGHFHFTNPAFNALFPNTPAIACDDRIHDYLMLHEAGDFQWQHVFKLATQTQWSGLVGIAKANNQLQLCAIELSLIDLEDQNHCLLVKLNPSYDQIQSNETLAKLAYKDSLTGLANRSLFSQLFDHEISQSQRLGMRFATLFIDLDKFKIVNDSMGHDVGDALLCTISERLQKSLRKSDIVARMGGDEFAVIMNNIKDSETVAKVTEKLIREIKKPVKSGANVMNVGCSIGISIYPDNGDSAEVLLQQADAAMYRAKHQGGNHYCYFSDALNQELQDIRLIERELEVGLAEHQFEPFFQPVIDQQSKSVVGIECLARWRHPQRGVLEAMEFIPIATKTGLLQDVFEQVLRHAIEHLNIWSKQWDLTIPLSINISSNQFYQQHTFDLIENLMKEGGLSNNAIRIEVTESTLQDSHEDLVARLKKIKLAGFSITLDDFGTGYSSLRYLQQLPVDIIKIDRSFVRNLDNNPHDKVIVKAIIQLAQTLDILVVAEGVENETQSHFLTENQCFVMQGYLFSQALPAEEFESFFVSYNESIV
ncbi:putative bifunctional diguanylate cyclase/phosphodiesterase [Aliiglaciecola litoralis]|uniref:Diguanylate cyclase (GGDEF) domain-containing protein n=1 Tax=Aliiglaciecola litoralis TaxID=582857 RepID=A0ABP3WND2_9ALTE